MNDDGFILHYKYVIKSFRWALLAADDVMRDSQFLPWKMDVPQWALPCSLCSNAAWCLAWPSHEIDIPFFHFQFFFRLSLSKISSIASDCCCWCLGASRLRNLFENAVDAFTSSIVRLMKSLCLFVFDLLLFHSAILLTPKNENNTQKLKTRRIASKVRIQCRRQSEQTKIEIAGQWSSCVVFRFVFILFDFARLIDSRRTDEPMNWCDGSIDPLHNGLESRNMRIFKLKLRFSSIQCAKTYNAIQQINSFFSPSEPEVKPVDTFVCCCKSEKLVAGGYCVVVFRQMNIVRCFHDESENSAWII